MISAFKFEAYKVDTVDFQMQPIIGVLELMGNIDPNLWKIDYSLREPIFVKSQKKYIGGMDIELNLFARDGVQPEGEPEKEEVKSEKGNDISASNKPLISLKAGIAGLFSTEEGQFEKEIEERLVKIQIPAILLPYLRGTVTSLLANAGFGSVILPLFNIQEASRGAKLSIKVID